MDRISSNLNLDIPSSKIHDSELSVSTTPSSSSNAVSNHSIIFCDSVVNVPSVTTKRIIRKITPLDPKKLQQAGLDRKIAEALSKQKSQQSSKSLNRTSNGLKLTYPKDASAEATVSKPANVQDSSAKNTIITKQIKLPKITITGPEVLTEQEKQGLANLDPHQRLIHVKHLLNKKLLQKKSSDENDNAKTSNDNAQTSNDHVQTTKHLKPPQSLYDRQNYKLQTKPPKEKPHTAKLFCVLKEPTEALPPPMFLKPTKIKTTQKSSQDIARKLDFQTDIETKAVVPGYQNSIKCLNKNTNEIPKASIKAGQSQLQYKSFSSNATHNYKQLQHGAEKGHINPSFTIINKSQEALGFPGENAKQQTITYSNEIPKASIKTGQSHQQDVYSSCSYKQLKLREQKLDYPEVSPLKVPFPTVNVPKETPLPAIDSFKKSYPMASSAYYDLQHESGARNDFVLTNYETALLNQQPSTSLTTSNLSNNAAINSSIPNCLIVLENKVLSQDEMIDLTELRLSTSKSDTPSFINPHKPIPEVVIKVENTDEYRAADVSTPMVTIDNPPEVATTKEIQTENKEISTERVVISNKQNKIIINAHKLKLPPEQLAALAKKIKQKSSASLPAVIATNQRRVQDIRIFNTKAASEKTSNKHTAYAVPHNIKIISQNPKEIPDKFVIKNKQIYIDVKNQDHNYQSKHIPQHIVKAIDNTNLVKTVSSTTIENKSRKIQLDNSHDTTIFEMSKNTVGLKDYSKSAVEILDEPLETEDCFSAVDFIAALSNTNPTSEENSLELSTEEFNLNASCVMNVSSLLTQSYPPCITTPICQKVSTPKMKSNLNDNLFNSRKLSTIVIESSKGPQCDNLNIANKLQTLEVFHNNVVREIEIQKSLEILPIPDSSMKPAVNAASNKLADPKLFDNVIVHDIEKSSDTLINNLTKKDNKLPTASLGINSANIIIKRDLKKSPDNANKSGHNITQLVLEPFKEPKNIDITNVKVANDPNQISFIISNVKPNENVNKDFISTSATQSSKLDLLATVATENSGPQKRLVVSPIKHAEKSYFMNQINTQCNKLIENETKVTNKETENFIISKNAESHQENILPTKPLEGDRSDFGKICCDFIKALETETNPKLLSQNDTCFVRDCTRNDVSHVTLKPSDNEPATTTMHTEASETSENNSNTTVTKRISRFKKGKINLVQRNKTGQVPNKSLSEDKNNEEKKLFDQIFNKKLIGDSDSKVDETHDELTTKENREVEENVSLKKSTKPLSESEKEVSKVTNQTSKTPEQITQRMRSKQTELATTRASDIKETQNTVIQNTTAIEGGVMHDSSETIHTSVQQNMPIENEKLFSLDGPVLAAKSLTKTTNNLQQNSNSPGKAFNIPKASINLSDNFQQNSNSQENRIDDDMDIPKAAIKTCDSSKQEESFTKSLISNNIDLSKTEIDNSLQHSNSSEKIFTKYLISNKMLIPKASVKISNNSQQLTSQANKSRQQIKLDTQKKYSPEVTHKQVIVDQQELQENITELTCNEPQVASSSEKFSESNELQDNIDIDESYTNISMQFDPPKMQTSPTLKTKTENLIQGSKIDISNKTENLNQESEAILKTMKNAKISVIDIVKHSPTKASENCPLIPCRTSVTSEESLEIKDIKTLSNQLKSSDKEKGEQDHIKQSKQQVDIAKSKEAPSENLKKSKRGLAKVDEPIVLASKRSSRSDSRTSESQRETPPPPVSTRKTYSARPLISDDDLEFLPDNAEVKFKLSKSKPNEKNEESNAEITPLTSATHKRQHRLYSKPLELELSSASQLKKRTRYYSQTLEANVTITFDNLKSKANTLKKFKPLETEESCLDSTQDSNITTPTKQRKKLRKTLEDIKKSQKSHNDTDSDDENHNYDCIMKDCEESNEFLGFEEISNTKSFENIKQGVKENEQGAKTKHGTLKNWLTTGKAISPTLDKMASTTRLRHDQKLQKYLKKNWSISSNRNEETDITDDTSPVDDEEEISEQIPISKQFKRCIKNVINIKEELIENTKIKLVDSMEHSFIKPINLRTKASGTDSDYYEEKYKKSRKHQTTKLEEVCTDSESNKEKVTKPSKELKCQVNSEESGTDADRHQSAESRHLKSKNKANIAKKPNNTSELESKNKTGDEVLDIGTKSHNLYTDCAKSKKSSHSKSKQKAYGGNIENLDIPPQQKAENKRKNSKNIPENTGENVKSAVFITEDADLPTQTKLNANTSNSIKEIEANDYEKSISTVDKDESEPSCTTSQNLTNKRKRGRPRVRPKKIKCRLSDQSSETNTSAIKEISGDAETSFLHMNKKKSIIYDSSEDDGTFPSTRKRNLKRKLKVDDSDSDSISTPLSKTQEIENVMNSLKPITTPRLGMIKNEISTPTAGRKRNTESNFNPRLLLITKREQLDTDEVITQTKLGSGAIQCGLCLGRTQPAKWRLHLAEHYGVGWQVGHEKLHVENRTVVLNNILNYMKDSKELTCRMCKKVYRSALGILLHIEACGTQAIRVICEFCKKDYAKASLPIHMRSCYARSAFENQSSRENLNESNEKKEEIFSNSGRLKRNSTIKAENKLKALGAELETVADNVIIEKSEVDPKSRIRYVPPLQDDFSAKWSKDIKKLGQASCPKARCKFASSDIQELSEHLKHCKHIKSGYFCKFCRCRVFKSEKEAVEHVIKNHQNGQGRKKSDDSDCDLKTDDEQSSDDNDLSEGVDENESSDNFENVGDDFDDVCHSKKGNKIQKTKIGYSRNLYPSTNPTSRKAVFDGRCTDLNKEVLKKWKSFLRFNYSCEPLYVEFIPQYSVINNPDLNNYLPSQTVSMKFHIKNKTTLNAKFGVPGKHIEWSELRRYESINNKMNTYFFLGASVKLCFWLPLPEHVNEQYLAIVYRQEMFKFIKFSQPKRHHNIVLIFKVTQDDKVPELNIHYGFLISDGPVHHLSFLPSGGYDELCNRLGLVAIATIKSDIKVYSLPINVEFSSTEKDCSINENITLIDVKPNFVLNLDILDKKEVQQHTLLNTQCLQICWSEYSGHKHVFASFSNGFLGIWDITNDPQQNLNRFVVDDIINYAALNYIYCGEKRVKCFAVHYDTCGPRWLAASGAYRKFVIYDIRNFMQPIIMKEEVNKNILLSMDWCPLWQTVLYSYCDTILNNGRCVVVVNPTNVMFPQNKLDVMVCSVTQVHYTPVTNMCVTALSNGDVVFLDTKELHFEYPLSKKFGERRILYAMDIKQLNGEPLVRLANGNQKNDINKAPDEWLMYDDNYKEKYGLIFESLIKLEEKDRKTYLSEKRCPPENMLPLMRINTLRCNVNLNGKNLIALGYENGFIRLINFNKETTFCN